MSISPDDLLKQILEESKYVQSTTLNYDEFLPEFILKAGEDLENIEINAINLEKDFGNMEVINSMFRSFHNIKGQSSFVGQNIIQQIAHQTENLLDQCRKGSTIANKEIINLLLISSDLIKQICDNTDLNRDEEFIDKVQLHIANIELQENNNLDSIIDGTFEMPKSQNDEFYFNNEFLEDFIISSKDHIDNIESNIIKLEKEMNNTEIIHLLFRDIHSIKGLAGFAGQTLIQRIAHETETLLDRCRKGNLKIEKSIINLFLKSIDQIKNICEDISIVKTQEFLSQVAQHLKDVENEESIQENQIQAEESLVDDEFLQDFIVEAQDHIENIESLLIEFEKNMNDQEIIHSMFRSYHTIKGLAGFVNQTLVQKIAHQTETLMDNCRKGKITVDKDIINLIFGSSDFIKKICSDINLIKDRAFLEAVNEHMLKLEDYDLAKVQLREEKNKKLGEILVEQKVIEPKVVQELLDKQKNEYPDLKFGEIALKEEKVKPTDIVNALKVQNTKQSTAEEYMRISTNKVDSLVDMVGELIIAQSLIEQHAFSRYGGDNFFITNLSRMTRITKDLQNISMFLRMVALKSTFQKITRIARDTINELKKDINFTTSGDETEIDRIVTEKLLDPLVHLVKNAISHGIEEDVEDRIKAGKPPQGSVTVEAYNKRGNIYIEIIDDGKGIDTEKVYKKALEKGLIDKNKDYSEKEIQEFILLPGFSTLEVANNISGRGVGMDVVKTEILKIGGKVEIKSEKGKGSSFILKIPVNHAVMNGTIVDIEGSNYIIPTINVKQIVQPKDEQWVSIQGQKSMIKIREDIIPLVKISSLFKTNSEDERPKLIVIIELEQKFKALPVRNVIGRQEIVVKPVGEEFSGLKYVSGMSILGDGKVSLILDIDNIFLSEGDF